MSKILAVADIHIFDYPNRNSFQYQRLYQGSRTVAQNIIDVGKKEGCDYIAICGDLIEKSILRPNILNEAGKFLETVMSEFREGWIILGNHDLDSKSSEQEETDSYLPLIIPSNLHYMHQKQINFEGKVIGFSNWQPEFDLSWVNGKLDILFTHATINYNGSDTFKSQVLDESKFDIAFCGDIHKPGQIGKYVSIGIPQRCKMSDGDKSTGIVIDLGSTTDNWWKWVDLNPNNNLMKFQYVTDQSQEGWNEVFNTWNIYKPDTSDIINPETGDVITGWDRIETLVLNKIQEKGLEEIHRDVVSTISDPDCGEVDFNFTLLKLYCKNWRSISEVTLNFEEGDKILVTGGNGSGKSSLLSAIKYAFCDVSSTKGLSSLKPFTQFNKENCITEVEFMYQGNRYRLRRGTETKECGLWINDNPQKYSSKKDFEIDARKRFPFIEYMELMIHDQDHNQFIGSLPGERLAEIISKIFKLDRIDTYNEFAQELLKKKEKESFESESKIKVEKELINQIEARISTIIVPSRSKEVLENLKKEKEELLKKSIEWNKFLHTSSTLQATIESLEKEVGNLLIEVSGFRDPSIINSEVIGFNDEISKLRSRHIEISGLNKEIKFKESELFRIQREGKSLRDEYNSIDPNKQQLCPTCHQPLPTNSDALLQAKNKLGEKLNEKIKEYRDLEKIIKQDKENAGNSEEQINNIQKEITSLTNKITERKQELSNQNWIKNKLNLAQKDLENNKQQLSSLGAPEKVELPDDFIKELDTVKSELLDIGRLELEMIELEKHNNLLVHLEKQVESIRVYQENLKSYIKLTGPTGTIYKEAIDSLISKFNDSQVTYKTDKKTFRGKEHFTLVPYYRHNSENEVEYEVCSGGQKTILDIHFLSKVINRLGLLILDEFLKHLDPENHDLCLDMIREMNVGCILISSHMESIASFNNKTCRLSLNDKKLTEIELK